MDTPARFERAHVGSKPTALSPLSYGALTEAAGVEPADGDRRHALATRCRTDWRRLQEEGEGVEPSRPCDPLVFETRYRADGSPSVSDSGRARTCASPGKSRELYRLSYGAMLADVAGRARTCDAPRFRRALYRLSFDHETLMESDRRSRLDGRYERPRSVARHAIAARQSRARAEVGEAGLEPAAPCL
jgi:hypothetical protein